MSDPTRIAFCVGKPADDNIQGFTKTQVLSRANKSLNYLNSIINVNDAALQKMRHNTSYYSFDKSDYNALYRGYAYIHRHETTRYAQLDEAVGEITISQKYITKLRNQTAKFMSNVKDPDNLIGEWFPLMEKCKELDGYSLTRVSPPVKISCAECGAYIMPSNEKTHQASRSCLHDRIRYKLRKDKWEQIDHMGALGQAVFDGTIPGGKIIPLNYEVWVPPWMAEAEAMWRSEQYAGMTLVEFMHKLFLEKQSEQGTPANQ